MQMNYILKRCNPVFFYKQRQEPYLPKNTFSFRIFYECTEEKIVRQDLEKPKTEKLTRWSFLPDHLARSFIIFSKIDLDTPEQIH